MQGAASGDTIYGHYPVERNGAPALETHGSPLGSAGLSRPRTLPSRHGAIPVLR